MKKDTGRNRDPELETRCRLKEGNDKEEMKEYIKNKMENASFCDIEVMYGFAIGLFGE